MTTASRWFENRRGLALGIVGSGINLGPLIAAPIASHIILKSDWRLSYFIMACAAAFIIPLALFLRKAPNNKKRLSQRRLPSEASITRRSGIEPETDALTLRVASRMWAFWYLGGMYLLVGFGLQMTMAHIVACTSDKGIPLTTGAAVLSVLTGSTVVGRVLNGILSDFIGSTRVLTISLLAEATMIFALVYASAPWMLFAIAAVFGFGYGGHSTLIPALIGETLGLRHMGSILGALVAFWGVGAASGPITAGYLYDITNTYTAAFMLASAGMMAVAGAAFFFGHLWTRVNSRVMT
jgi:MFS family permease